ncbi:MAG: FAD-dependent oxidoreductase [Bacteroidota bacterium]
MPWTWYDSTIIRIEQESPNTKRFWLEVEALDQFDFTPGQFITMDLPIHQKRLKRWRSYSIASVPAGNNIIELCIVYLEKGAASQYLFETARVGTPIKFKGPAGAFTLPKTIDSDLVLICTGTGVAPFRSMILDLQKQGKSHRNIHLIFGTRREEGLLYRQEFEQLLRDMDQFQYSIALSRSEHLPSAKPGQDFYPGYVHQIYEQYYAKLRSDVHFYLCGWSNMVDEAQKRLTEDLGYAPNQVHCELYG